MGEFEMGFESVKTKNEQQMKVIHSRNCGNSPKQKFAEDYTIALLGRNRTYLAEHSAEGVVCRFQGNKRVAGLAALLEAVPDNPKAITIHNVITHGKVGSSNASLEAKGSELVEFAFFFLFENAKGTSISEVTLYRVEA